MSRTATLVILLLTASPAVGQTPVQRGAHWPDAAGVVQMFVDGKHGVAISTALGTCPRQNPYGDSVWAALLSAPPTPELTTRLAAAWSGALRSCNDPRLEAWYHSRLAEASDLLSAVPILSALLRHGTPESLDALKQVAFDETRSQELRSEILRGLADDWNRRMSIYLEAVVETERLPEPYGQDEWAALTGSPILETFALRALDLVPRHPGYNTATLLSRLAGLNEMTANPNLRARMDDVTRAILTASPQRYPAVLRDAAVRAKEVLERRR